MDIGTWVVHRDHGVGRVLEVEDDAMAFEFRDGRLRLGRPYKVRRVEETSLDVRAFLDRTLIPTRLETDPSGFAFELLAEVAEGSTGRQLQARLVALGANEEEAAQWWLAVMPVLQQSDQVDAPSDSAGPWKLKRTQSTELPKVSPSDLLIRLTRKTLKAAEKKQTCGELAKLAEAGDLTAAERVAAVRLGCALPESGRDLSLIDPSELPAAVVSALATSADAADLAFMVAASMQPRDTLAAKEAADRARELDAGTRIATLVAERIENAGSDALAEVAGRTAACLIGARRLLADRPASVRLWASAIRLRVQASTEESNAAALTELVAAIDQMLNATDPSAETISSALRHEAVATTSADGLAKVLTTVPLREHGARIVYLEALANTGRREVAASRPAWQGVTLDELAAVAETPLIRSMTGGGPAPGIEGVLSAVLAQSRPRRADFATMIAHPAILEACRPALLERWMANLAETDPEIQKAIQKLAQPLVEGIRREHAEEVEHMITAHRSELLASERRFNVLKTEHDELEKNAEFLRSQVRRDAGAEMSASSAEVRQARIDGLRTASAILAEGLRWVAGHPDQDRLLTALEAIAAESGLSRIGNRDDVVTFDPEVHRMLAGDPGPLVAVVEPGWAARLGNDSMTIQHAKVRAAE